MTHKGPRSRNQQSLFGEGKWLQNHDISGPESSQDHEMKSSLLRTRLATTKTASRHKLPFWEQRGLCSFIDSSRRKTSFSRVDESGPSRFAERCELWILGFGRIYSRIYSRVSKSWALSTSLDSSITWAGI